MGSMLSGGGGKGLQTSLAAPNSRGAGVSRQWGGGSKHGQY